MNDVFETNIWSHLLTQSNINIAVKLPFETRETVKFVFFWHFETFKIKFNQWWWWWFMMMMTIKFKLTAATDKSRFVPATELESKNKKKKNQLIVFLTQQKLQHSISDL